MTLTFKEAAKGVNKEVTVDVVETCKRCGGSRAEPGSKAETCPQCKGTGMVSVISSIFSSFFGGYFLQSVKFLLKFLPFVLLCLLYQRRYIALLVLAGWKVGW